MEVGKLQHGARKAADSEKDSDEDLEQDNNDKKEDDEDFGLDENEKIKYNLKNSSSVYYKITHSI
jgi:hypothetical protein